VARSRPKTPVLELVIAVLVVVIFAIDVQFPRGVTIWMVYVVPLALSLFTSRPVLPYVVAVAACGLTALDFVATTGLVPAYISVANRTLGGVVFIGFAAAGSQHIRGRLALRDQDWSRTVQAGFLERLQGDIDAAEVAERSLDYLGRALDAPVGAFFVAEDDGVLRRAAVYGGAVDDVAETIRPGDGQVGVAIRDRRVRHLRGLPAGYLAIASATGRHDAAEVAIVPAVTGDRAVAAFELGFLRPIAPIELELLDRIAEAIAVTIQSARYRRGLQDLLEETQRQAEELQGQQEELRVLNEELVTQTAALRDAQTAQERSQVELEEINANLEAQTAALESQREELLSTQRQLRSRAEELDRSSKYKSEFLANMSHELRTPLNSAQILARLLADNPTGNLTPEQVKYAETIYAAGHDLLLLISDVLDLAKIEAGRLDLKVGAVAIARVRDALRRAFEPVATAKGLRFAIDVDPDVPALIDSDEVRLSQILRNLLSNAIKFTVHGEVVLHVSRDGDWLRWEVRDTGIGIAPDQQGEIFEAFRQADGSISRRYGGTGLGLSISRDLARLLGGEITMTSAPGGGSTFRLVIPAAGPPAVARTSARPVPAPPPAAPPPRRPPIVEDDRARLSGGRCLLVIEDDPEFARILVQLARELDFQCVVADSADEGVRLARELGPSGILLDIHLPDDSGLTVLERLKRDPATRHVPVHVVSVSDVEQRALQMGAVGYLVKPADRDALVAAVRKVESRLSPRTRRLLVVEDDPSQRDSVCQLLTAPDVEITAVPSVADALAALTARSFECVVTDLTLADGTGFDLLDKMASDERISFPPVIVYTGTDLGDDDEQRLRWYGASVIVKGARSPERLLDEVTLFLHQVEADLPSDRQRMLREVRDRDAVFAGRTVLIVEDDVRNVFALTSILEPKGATTVIARNGREALEALDRSGAGIDLVLMDVMMPEMNGLEATRKIRGDGRWKTLPIIALTAKAMPDDREACIAAGASDYLAKPIDVDRLLSLLRVWLPRTR
jgi:signal transduction histidine kinase/CheY-like chemotaxis protein